VSDTKQSVDERRKAREGKRAALLKEIRDRNAEQTEDVEDLIDRLGINPLEVVIIPTDLGIVACQKASTAETSRFLKAVNSVGKPGRKQRDTGEDTKAYVRSARLYPEETEFEGILLAYPLVWESLGSGLADLAGAAFEADVRKN